MCKRRGRTFCSELGADSALWSKNAPLDKPQWITDAFRVLTESVLLAEMGKMNEAKSLLGSAPDLEMRVWFNDHAQNSGAWRNRAIGVAPPAKITPLDEVKQFTRLEPVIFARDDMHCRYCGFPVLLKKTFRNLQGVIGADALPLGRSNLTRSGFYLMFVATLDHVFPWSLGGRTDETNLVTCCWSCNYGKANFTVEQLGIIDPRETIYR